jgi:hypothetical protein
MGFFVYDDVRAIRVDDRVLAHLQIVVIDKLRRQEKFILNLNNGHGLVTMWLNAYTPMQFVYEGNRAPRINIAWIELLAGEAGLTGVLELLPEPPEPHHAVDPQPSSTPVGAAQSPEHHSRG